MQAPPVTTREEEQENFLCGQMLDVISVIILVMSFELNYNNVDEINT